MLNVGVYAPDRLNVHYIKGSLFGFVAVRIYTQAQVTRAKAMVPFDALMVTVLF